MTTKQDALEQGQQAIRNFRLEEALENLLPLANAGNADAQYIVSDIYTFDTRTIPEDPEHSDYWLTTSALNGHVAAKIKLKINSLPFKSSLDQEASDGFNAALWELLQALEQICDEDDTRLEDSFLLGLHTILGLGCPQNRRNGAARLLANAHKGDLRSMAALGQCMISFEIDSPDLHITGEGWIERAIDNGDYMAAYTLGQMYESGDWLPCDVERARHFYEISARRGYLKAEKALIGFLTTNNSEGVL